MAEIITRDIDSQAVNTRVSSGRVITGVLKHSYFYVNWEIASQSIAGNSTVINWTAGLNTGGATSNYDYWYSNAVKINSIHINNVEVCKNQTYSNIGLDKGKDYPLVSGTLTIPHESDGNKTFNIGISGWLYSYGDTTGSYNFDLINIPRYTTVTQELKSKIETSINMSWSTEDTVDYIWYSKDNGSNWTGIDITDGKSGSYSITGLTANTTYNIKTRVRRKDSQLTSDSSALSVTTYDYPHITKVGSPNLVIGYPQKLTLYNPLSRAVTVKMYNSSDGVLHTASTSGTTIEFTPTATTLYNNIPNSQSGKTVYSCEYNTSVRKTTGNYTYVIDTVYCIPTFNNFTYKDNNTKVTAVTGNDQILVKGLSNLQVAISSANKMVTKYSSSPNKYIATIDILNKSVAYSTADINLDVGVVVNSGTKRLIVTAYDSRNLSKSVYKDITVYDYIKPTINLVGSRLNNFEAQTTIKVNGTFTPLSINGVNKNTITAVQYRYREAGGTWSSWTNLTTSVTGNKYTCNDLILSLDNTKAFEIEIQAIDKLDSNSDSTSIDIGQAIFLISTNKKACYINGEIIKLGYREPAKLVNGDYNSMCGLESGFYKSTSTTNAPYTQAGQNSSTNWFFIIHTAHSELHQMQIASPFFEDGLYFRNMRSGSWSPWKSIGYDLLDSVYPVGSIYMSVNSTDPSELFGGTWEQIAQGRTLVGVDTSDTTFNTVEKTGGSKTQELRALLGATNSNSARIGYLAKNRVDGKNYSYSIEGSNVLSNISSSDVAHSTLVTDIYGNTPSNIQPYFTCYMWKRTA